MFVSKNQLPQSGVFYTGMFFMNITGNSNKNDVKLMALVENQENELLQFAYLNNKNEAWQTFEHNAFDFPKLRNFRLFGIAYYVSVYICVLRYKNIEKKIKANKT